MKIITFFEAIADHDSGWEFDMPIVMFNPVLIEGQAGNIQYFENMIEDYMIDISLGQKIENDEHSIYNINQCKRYKNLYLNKKSRKGVIYLMANIEWDTSDNEDNGIIKIIKSLNCYDDKCWKKLKKEK
jgi:hypothetical protein